MNLEEQLRVSTENLYKHSLELATKNKILTFLGELYELAVHALDRQTLASEIAHAIQAKFEFEIVAIYSYDSNLDSLQALVTASSERVATCIINETNLQYFPAVSTSEFFKPVIKEQKFNYSEKTLPFPNDDAHKVFCQKIEENSYIRSTLAYPLSDGPKVNGVVLICLNRIYEDLVDYERDSIKSFVDVVSITLSRAALYEEIRLANEHLKRVDKLKNEFVSIASHQMRSPLTAIRGYTSMMLEGSFGPVPEKFQEPLQRIVESSALMATSVEDYLSVSQIESGNMKYNNTDFNLAVEIEKVVNDLRRSATKKSLELTIRSNISSGCFVHADLGKTEQIIHNLITNAIKYTQTGSIEAYVHDDPQKNLIHFDVIDTGIGMSTETLEELFGKFVRAKNAHVINVTGTGLGLYIAREMARKMGGDITATSPGEGKGSTFRLTLPLKS